MNYMRFSFPILFLFLSLLPYNIYANGKKIQKIVIDAGHGGSDIGARGKFSYEKDLTLAVALRLGNVGNIKFQKRNGPGFLPCNADGQGTLVPGQCR